MAQSEQCLNCNHYWMGQLACKAFPNGIPAEVFTGRHDHTKPFHGDNGILFEKYSGVDEQQSTISVDSSL